MLMLLCNIVTSNQHQGINVILSIICLILILFYLTRCYYTRYCRECDYSDYKSYCNSYPKHMYISFHKIRILLCSFPSLIYKFTYNISCWFIYTKRIKNTFHLFLICCIYYKTITETGCKCFATPCIDHN